MKIVKRIVPVLVGTMAFAGVSMSQTPQTSGADTSRNKTTVQKITDTGFISNNIKQQILDIRIAQLAASRATTPKVKDVARQIVGDGRENLRRLLSLTNGQNLPGLTQAEITQALGEAGSDSTMSASDPRAAATSGNTVTDSLGSGSSGSGNVSGEDTGTLARTTTDKRNASYSQDGDYAYNNNLFMHEAEILNTAKGKSFDAQWVKLMLRKHQAKIEHYNQALNQVTDPKLKVAITQALPKIRLHNGTLLRISKNKDIADGMDNQKGQDDKINSGALETDRGNPGR